MLPIAMFSQTSNQQDFEERRRQMQQEFENFKAQNTRDFENFRAETNAKFAEFMGRSWERFNASQGIPVPKSPEPEKPPVADPEKRLTSQPLPLEKITPQPAPTPRAQPLIQPLPPTPHQTPSTETYAFLFYNTNCYVNLDNSLRFSLPNATEKMVAQTWKTLSNERYDALLSSCLTLREQLNLSDWGYFQMLKTFSESFFGEESDEAVLLQMYILTQSGYKVRIARTDGRLALLIPFKEPIYAYSFLNIDGMKYYIVNKVLQRQSFHVFNHEFPKEQYFSWQTGLPNFSVNLNPPKPFVSKNSEINGVVQTNQNLIDFFNDHPQSDSEFYVHMGLSETVKQTLYPTLRNAIAGQSKFRAAEILLDFCQTAFDYQTCAEQFGHERPFFLDENFFFPYNNCKHRATLYAFLVKDLLNLDVVLLHYPARLSPNGIGHLATAVHFPEFVNGDYFTIEGKNFVVCDPTYIGASIGMTMDKYKQIRAEIIRL